MNRVQHERGFVLHRYDFSESSVILEVFTLHHGRVALIAKGAKKPSSNFRPVLLPLQPLSLNWGGDAEVRTLKGAEWLGGSVMPVGNALWSGLYANELLLKLLARDDAHPQLFGVYAATVQLLCAGHASWVDLALRAFELALLRAIGLLPNLEQEASETRRHPSDTALKITPEAGLQPLTDAADEQGIAAAQWAALEHAVAAALQQANAEERDAAFNALMQACEPVATALKHQLRRLLHYHCASPTLKTRQVMLELKNL